jgi:acyl transferase domain-containing protein/acyl carrier protein
MILEEAPEPVRTGRSRSYQLLLLSAKTDAALEIATSNLESHLTCGAATLPDTAFTLQAGRTAFNHRRVVVCSDVQDAVEALRMGDPRRVFSQVQTCRERPVAFMFPGVGEHYVGMGRDLYLNEPTFCEWINKGSELLFPHLKQDIREIVYPANHTPPSTTENDRLRLMLSRHEDLQSKPGPMLRPSIGHPTVFVVEYALAQLLIEWGLVPRALMGYSLGEYTAACIAGVLSLDDALKVVAKRAQLLETLDEGGMVTVALGEAHVARYIDSEISLAAVLNDDTCVLAGPRAACDELGHRLSAEDVAYRKVLTTHALHSRMMQPIAADLEALLRTVRLNRPQIPFVSNLTGTWITNDEATDPGYWVKHMCSSVRLADCIDALLRNQNQTTFEVGPGQSLTAFARQLCNTETPNAGRILPTLRSEYDNQSDGALLLTTLGQVWLDGVEIDWAGFYRHESRGRVSLPAYPFEQRRYLIEPGAYANERRPAPFTDEKSKKKNISDWFYLPSWKQTPLRRWNPQASAAENDRWLFLIDHAGHGQQLADVIEAGGRKVERVYAGSSFSLEAANHYTVNPVDAKDYQKLWDALGGVPLNIVHLWSLDSLPDVDEQARFAIAQRTGFYSLINLIKGLAGHSEPLRVWVVTNQCHSVTGSERLNVSQSTIEGICRVIPQENMNITCQTIDIDCCPNSSRRTIWLTSQLVAELLDRTDDLSIAYRGNSRWIQCFEPLNLERINNERAWNQGGVYLIVGGLGEVGMCIARHLAQISQAKIIMTSRSDPTAHRLSKVQEFEAIGAEVWIARADAADQAQMDSLLSEIDRRYGALHGVFYTAGVSGDAFFSPVQEITEDQCEAHFRSKVMGLHVLAKALENRSLDFCVIFSSISSVLGGLGFSAYAAANRFIDVFTQHYNQQHNGWWTCVNWDTWRTRENLHDGMGATVATFDMLPDEATEALSRVILNRPLSRVINSTGDLESRIDQWVRLLSIREAETQSREGRQLYPRPSFMGAYVEPTNDTEKIIVEIWQSLLGFAPIGVNDNFLELGGHSLIATQIISRLRQRFRVHLPLAILLMSPTVSELALAIELAIIEEIEKLPDESIPG